MYELAVFDIDGTLAIEGNTVLETTLVALKKLRERGVECLIATGRERENLDEILDITGIENYVACNGHYVKYEGEILYRYTYPEDHLEEIRRICEKEGYYYGFSNGKGIYISDLERFREDFCHPLLKKLKLLEKLEGEVENVILFSSDGGRDFKPLEENYQLGPWGNGIFDLVKNGRSKAAGIDEIAKRLGVERERIISFGDGLNDLEMTEYAGLGIAMGNAKEELKKIADHITDRADNHGIYNACKKFGLI